MNNLKSMLSKSSANAEASSNAPSQSDESFGHITIDDFFADVMKAASERASDINSFRSGAAFALSWFSEKIGEG